MRRVVWGQRARAVFSKHSGNLGGFNRNLVVQVYKMEDFVYICKKNADREQIGVAVMV